MKVVSNTSPLTNLAAIGQFDLLRKYNLSKKIPIDLLVYTRGEYEVVLKSENSCRKNFLNNSWIPSA